MKRVFGLLALSFLLVACASAAPKNVGFYGDPPIATPTPAPWIESCPDPVYKLSRGSEFPDEIPTTFYESYSYLGDFWNDQVADLWLFPGAQVRVFWDEYKPGDFERNFSDLDGFQEHYSFRLTDKWGHDIDGISAIMIRKCSDLSASPYPTDPY